MEHTKDLCDGCGLCCNSILWPGVHVDESKTHLFNTITPDKGFNHNGEFMMIDPLIAVISIVVYLEKLRIIK